MRSARALLASLGAGICLIAAGTFALATVSALVAFNGLPGTRSAQAGAPITLASVADSGRRPVKATAPNPISMPVAAQVAAARGSRVAGRRFSARPGTGPAVTTAVPATSAPAQTTPARTPTSPPARQGTQSATPAPAVPGTAQTTAAGGPVRDAGAGVGAVVTQVTGALAQGLAPVSPQAAGVVGATGQVTSDTVRMATDVLAGLLDGRPAG